MKLSSLRQVSGECKHAPGRREKFPEYLADVWREKGRPTEFGHTIEYINVREEQRCVKIYVASSWRNLLQPAIVTALRRIGHDVYDFKHPAPGNEGFSWRQTGVPEYRHGEFVSPETWKKMLATPVAAAGFKLDMDALKACDVVVYVLPCGRSASWEFGYAMGQGKPGFVVAFDDTEPELMFREAKILANMSEFFDAFGEPTS